MTETAWLAIGSPLLAALVAAVAYLWKARDTFYEKQIGKLELEVASGRNKIAELQDKALAALQTQLDESRAQADIARRVASSLEQNTATLKTIAGLNE